MWAILFAGMYCFSSILASGQTTDSSTPIRLVMAIGYAVIASVLFRLVNSWRTVSKVVGIFSLLAVSSIITDFSGITELNFILFGHQYSISPGILGEPNFGAQLLNFLLVFNIYGFVTSHRAERVFYVLTTLFSVTGLLLMGSRTGFLILVVEFFLVSWLIPSARKLPAITTILSILFLITGGGLLSLEIPEIPENYLDRWVSVIAFLRGEGMVGSSGYSSIAHRIGLFKAGLQGWLSSPIFGIGPQNTMDHYSSFPQFRNLWGHNTYLDVALGVGVLGLVPFVGLGINILRKLYRLSLASYHDNGDTFLRLMFIGFVGLLISLFFLTDIFNKLLWGFYLPLAISCGDKELSNRANKGKKERDQDKLR
jgi:O-antigen ligase